MNKIALVSALLLAASPAMAQQPQPQPSPIREAVDATYALGLQTGQSVTTMLKEQDDRLKWVLDNWVPKQVEPSAPPK